MRGPAFFLLFLLFALPVVAQPSLELRQLLKARDIPALKKHVDEYRSYYQFDIDVSRPVVGAYQHWVLALNETERTKDGRSLINRYRVQLLAVQETIFYYQYEERRQLQPGEDNWKTYGMEVKDTSMYAGFESLFQQLYHAPVQEQDLFLTSVVYGGGCGYSGESPEPLVRLNSFINTGEADSIRLWLQSPNAEKQLYAIRGYRALTLQGYELSAEEKNVLSLVRGKTGPVRTCAGCLTGWEDFQQVLTEIDQLPFYMLLGDGFRYYNWIAYDTFSTTVSRGKWWLISALVVATAFTATVLWRRRKKQAIV